MSEFTKPILFTFGNFYLAGIHAGIQAAHVCTKLASIYEGKSKAYQAWARFPTMNVRHAGMCRDITEQFDTFSKFSSIYPTAAFYEEDGALGVGIEPMTCWGVILPAEVYQSDILHWSSKLTRYSDSAECFILDLIKTTSLAK